MKYLLDTKVIFEVTKQNPDKRLEDFIKKLSPDSSYISVLSVGELRNSITKIMNNPSKKQKLLSWLENDLNTMFTDRILPIDREVVSRWGFITANLQQLTPVIDSLLAATALTHNLAIVTKNYTLFKNFNLEVINPWQA